jgi:hypothetical protein
MKPSLVTPVITVVLSFVLLGQLSAQTSTQISTQTPTTTPTQTVRGTVLNSATQQPIPGATVRIAELAKGTNARPDGTFAIKTIPSGRYTVRVSALGYEPYSAPVVVTSGKELLLTLLLSERIIKTEEVAVNGSQGGFAAINESALISANVFTLDDAYRFAGARGDVARMASAFAGVVSANDQRNDIIIRGGSPTELLWRLDGLDVPNPNHFATQGATGGPVGAVNSNVLANSDFLTGAFPAEYGDRMSGVFDLRTRKGNDEKFEFMGQFGFNGIEAMVEGPMPFVERDSPQARGSSFLVNYRKSFLGILSALGVNFVGGGIPDYEDFTLKLDLNAGERDKIWLTSLLGTSNIDIRESKADIVRTGNQDTRNGTDILAVSANWRHFFSDRTFGTLLLGGVASRFRTDLDSITADADFKPSAFTAWYRNRAVEGYGTAKYTLSHSPDAQSVFTSGIEARLRFFDLNEFRTTTSFGTSPFSAKSNGTALHLLAFANWNYRLTDEFTFNLGLHSQYLGISRKATLEPRAAMAWNFAPTQTLTFGTGLYRQSQPLALYFETTGNVDNRSLDFSQALHYVLGYSNQFAPEMLFKAEVYYKDYARIPVQSTTTSSFSMMNAGANFGGVSGSGQLANDGKGRSYGAEFSFVKHFAGGWYAQTALSLVRQEYAGSDGVWRNGAFDNQYVVNVLAGYEWRISEDFTIEFATRYARAGGSPRTPIDLESSRRLQATVRNSALAFSERNPDYERIDARIDFRQNFNGWAIVSYFSVENLINRRNILSQSYNLVQDRVVDVSQLGRFFVGGVRVEF